MRHNTETAGGDTNWGQYEISGPRHRYRLNILMKLIETHVPRGATVLDIGCGSGKLLMRLAGKGYEAIGRDASREFVERIEQRIPTAKLSGRIEVKAARAEKLDLPDRSVDAVVLSEVLEHLPDERPALKEIKRVMKEDSVIFITVPADPDLWSSVDEGAGHYRRYTSITLTDTLVRSGFRVEYLRWWGFPITRLYEKLMFKPWAKRRTSAGKAPGAGGSVGAIARLSLINIPISWVLSLDELFPSSPSGIGLIAIAKPEF